MFNFQTWVTIASRTGLLGLLCLAGYIALQPSYNMAHWTPNLQMRALGFSYDSILAYEHHFHNFMHISVSFMTTFLLYFARVYFPHRNLSRILCGMFIVIVLILLLEGVQSQIGRETELIDFVLGIVGTLTASALLYLLNMISGGKSDSSTKTED